MVVAKKPEAIKSKCLSLTAFLLLLFLFLFLFLLLVVDPHVLSIASFTIPIATFGVSFGCIAVIHFHRGHKEIFQAAPFQSLCKEMLPII